MPMKRFRESPMRVALTRYAADVFDFPSFEHGAILPDIVPRTAPVYLVQYTAVYGSFG